MESLRQHELMFSAFNPHPSTFHKALPRFFPEFPGHMNIARQGGGNGPVQKTGAFMVINVGPGIDMGCNHPNQFFFFNHPADFTLRIAEITESAGFGRTGYHARRFFSAL